MPPFPTVQAHAVLGGGASCSAARSSASRSGGSPSSELEQAAQAVADLAGELEIGVGDIAARREHVRVDQPVPRRRRLSQQIDIVLDVDRVEKRLDPEQRHRRRL